MSRVSGMSGDFPVQLATRSPDLSAGGPLVYSAARLSVCRVVLQIPRARLVADKSQTLIASSSDTSVTPDSLVTY